MGNKFYAIILRYFFCQFLIRPIAPRGLMTADEISAATVISAIPPKALGIIITVRIGPFRRSDIAGLPEKTINICERIRAECTKAAIAAEKEAEKTSPL